MSKMIACKILFKTEDSRFDNHQQVSDSFLGYFDIIFLTKMFHFNRNVVPSDSIALKKYSL